MGFPVTGSLMAVSMKMGLFINNSINLANGMNFAIPTCYIGFTLYSEDRGQKGDRI